MKKIRLGRVTMAARKQTIRTVFREFGWILKKLKHADDDMKDLCTIKSVTALEQFIRQVLITLIETGKIPPDKLVKGELPGPERLGGISLAQHIAFSQNFQNMDTVKSILREIGMYHVFDRLCESDRAALKALFKHRHDIVHTSVKLPPTDINRCFGAVLALINCIMSEIYPGGHHYYLYMGDCMSHSREYQEAITYYNMALVIHRDDPYIVGKIGEAFAGLGLHKRAVECYNRAIALDPGSPVHARKGESLAELDRHREAVECYNRAIALNPDDPFVHTKKGESLAKLERFGEAVECYNRAIALNPNDSRVHVLKGESLARMDKHEEAIICYNRALTLDPGNSHAYVLKGVSLANMDKHEEAIIHYDRGLDIHPDDPYALARKGASLARLKQFERAVASYNRSLALNPNDSWVHVMAGISLAGLGRHEEAIIHYDRALALDPDDPDTLARKGISLAGLGRHKEAITHYDRALALDPDNPYALAGKEVSLTRLGRSG